MLPTDYQAYYVYKHIDPETKEILYIGSGQFERAWNFKRFTSRSQEHSEALLALYYMGYTPDEWVVIVDSGLSKKAANALEMTLLQKHRPTFNKHIGVPGNLVDQDKIIKAKELLANGVVGRQAAKELKCSIMSAWRYQYVY